MSATLNNRQQVENATDFGRVAVLLGGHSSERDVSLKSGTAVLHALQSKNVQAEPWDPSEKPITELGAAGFDRAWNALHGPGGEDGAIQGALLWMNIPCTGSGVGASALAMDKVRSKHVFAACGIPTPPYLLVEQPAEAHRVADELGFPLVVKPACQGSSIGMSMAADVPELEAAIALAMDYDATVLVESFVAGEEITVAVLQGRALPSIRIETPREFYDYRAKYEADSTRYICPSTADASREKRYAELACAAFDALGCAGWGRVDFMHEPERQPQVIEINTVPGMTDHSLVPIAAKAAGMDFAALCWRILETSFATNPRAIPMKAAANDA